MRTARFRRGPASRPGGYDVAAMATALITGGAGFIGSHLVDALLARGWEVVALDNFDPFYPREIKERNLAEAMKHPAFRLVEADITDAEALNAAFDNARPELVCHLAARAGVRPSIADPAGYALTNVVGTQRVLDAAARLGSAKVIVASSSSVYGNHPEVPFAESHDVSRPISPYAATKVATELLCATFVHLTGIPVTALRFFTVFGPRQRPDLAISRFLAAVSRGEPITLFGDGSTSRDYTYVEDIVAGVVAAVERCGSMGPFRIYNLGGEHPVNLSELVAAIEVALNSRAQVVHAPPQPGDVERTYADVSRAREELGYEPRTSLGEGLARQWAWMQASGGA